MMTLNHGFSGYVCSRVVLPAVARRAPLTEGWLALAVFLGAVLPDIDAAGNLLGRGVYFSAAWYGHRNASHSILGTLILATIAAGPLAALVRWRSGVAWAAAYRWLVPAFWAGGLLHIVGDLVTPGMPMPVFWPLAGDYGSLRHIGWFSPFLLWLFLGALVIDATLRRFGDRLPALAPWKGVVLWGMHAFVAVRWLHFLYVSRYESPGQWYAYQRTLLPDAMIGPVAEAVHGAWHWMTR